MMIYYKLQQTYSARDILAVIERVKKKYPALTADPEFLRYSAYFTDAAEWGKDTERWLENDLEKIAQYCKRKGITLIVKNYPCPFPANAKLKTVAEKHSLPFIDNCTQFARLLAAHGRDGYFLGDDHCTPEGNRIIAENVFRAIQPFRKSNEKTKNS